MSQKISFKSEFLKRCVNRSVSLKCRKESVEAVKINCPSGASFSKDVW